MADWLSGFGQAIHLQHVVTEQGKLALQQEALGGTLATEKAKQDREYAQSLLEARKHFANDPMRLMQIDQQLWPRLQLQPLSPTQWMEYLPAIQEAYAAYDRKDMKAVGEILMQRLPPSVTEGIRRQQAFENIGQASDFPAGSGEAIAASPQLQQQAGQRITEPKMRLQADVAAGKPISEQQQIVAGVRQPYPTTEVTALQREQIEKNKADTALHKMTFSLMVRGLEFDRKAFRDDTKVASVMSGFEKKGIADDERKSLLSSATPESRAFSQNKDARLQQVTQSLDTLEDQASKLRLIQADFRTGQPLPQGYDTNRVEAESAVTARMLAMKRAEKDWLDHPTASTFAKYQETRQEGERFIADLENKIRLLGDERNVLQRGRLEIALRKEQYDTNVAKAQADLAALQIDPKDPKSMQREASKLASQYGVKVSDITSLLPHAGTEVTITQEKQTPQSAGQLNMMNLAIQEIQQVRSFLFDAQGNVNRSVLASASVGQGLPFTKGRTLNTVMEDVISSKYRIETGAAGNAEEVKSIVKRFSPSLRDSDELVKDKLARLEWWLKATVSTVDPKAELRKRADMLDPTPKSHTQFITLKNKFPQATDEQIYEFLSQQGKK